RPDVGAGASRHRLRAAGEHRRRRNRRKRHPASKKTKHPFPSRLHRRLLSDPVLCHERASHAVVQWHAPTTRKSASFAPDTRSTEAEGRAERPSAIEETSVDQETQPRLLLNCGSKVRCS